MPATAGRVRMPLNNRLSVSDSLRTSEIWQKSVGYDPYAPTEQQQPGGTGATGGRGSHHFSIDDHGGEINEKAKGLFVLARLTGSSSAVTPGACRKCGQVGHLAFQCRNYLSTSNKTGGMAQKLESEDEDEDEDEDDDDDKNDSDDDGKNDDKDDSDAESKVDGKKRKESSAKRERSRGKRKKRGKSRRRKHRDASSGDESDLDDEGGRSRRFSSHSDSDDSSSGTSESEGERRKRHRKRKKRKEERKRKRRDEQRRKEEKREKKRRKAGRERQRSRRRSRSRGENGVFNDRAVSAAPSSNDLGDTRRGGSETNQLDSSRNGMKENGVVIEVNSGGRRQSETKREYRENEFDRSDRKTKQKPERQSSLDRESLEREKRGLELAPQRRHLSEHHVYEDYRKSR